ncbi:hypothetical protein ACG904_18455 [Acinetobacter guillouiae]|uniref:hypothetical protein n=1 Tax=Acinetobacter guillouiae TaxID=106649 RepID=UPI003AF6FC72
MKKILLTCLMVGLVGCSEPEKPTSKTSNTNQKSLEDSPNFITVKEFSPLVFTTYNKENFPKAYAQWGDDGIERIKQLEKDAVFKVATENNKCNYLEIAGLSEVKSIPNKEAVVFIDCGNKERFYVSEKDIKNKVFVDLRFNEIKNIGDGLAQCTSLVKQLKNDKNISEISNLDSSGFDEKGNNSDTAVSIRFNQNGKFERARCSFKYTGEKIVQFLGN